MKESAKKFYCEFAGCEKSFNRRDYLERHAVNHLAVKPFYCRQCKRHFSRKDLYDNHLNTRFHAKRLEELALASSTRMRRHRAGDMTQALEDRPEFHDQQPSTRRSRYESNPIDVPAASELDQPLLPLNNSRQYANQTDSPPQQDTYWQASISPSTFASGSPTDVQSSMARSLSQSPQYQYESAPVEIPDNSFPQDFNVNVFAFLNGGTQQDQYLQDSVLDPQAFANEANYQVNYQRTSSNVSEPSLIADDWNNDALDTAFGQPETPSEYLSTANVYLGPKTESLLFDELTV